MLHLFLILVVVLSPVPGQHSSNSDTLLLQVALAPGTDGWKRDGNAMFYHSEDWDDNFPGMAKVFCEYGLNELLSVSYIDVNSNAIEVLIQRFAEPEGAYGMFSVSRGEEGDAAGYGNEAYSNFKSVHFWKGHYYVRILADSGQPHDREGMAAIARMLNEIIVDDGTRPKIVEMLPEESFVTDKTRYFMGSSAMQLNLPFGENDIDGFIQGVYSDFGTHQLMLFEYQNEDTTRYWLGRIAENLGNSKQYLLEEDCCGMVRFKDKNGNTILFESSGKYIMAYSGIDLTRQPEIFEWVEDAIHPGRDNGHKQDEPEM